MSPFAKVETPTRTTSTEFDKGLCKYEIKVLLKFRCQMSPLRQSHQCAQAIISTSTLLTRYYESLSIERNTIKTLGIYLQYYGGISLVCQLIMSQDLRVNDKIPDLKR